LIVQELGDSEADKITHKSQAVVHES